MIISVDINEFLVLLTGLWNCVDGFYYDQIRSNDKSFIPRHLKIKSVAGFISLFGRCSIRLWELQEDCPKLYQWMTENQEKLNKSVSYS